MILRAALAPAQGPRNAYDIEIRKRAGSVPWQEFEDWYDGGVSDEVVLAPADEEAFADPAFAEGAMAALTEGSRQGALGGAGDQWAFATPWGFDFASIVQPVEIWHGEADTRVPLSHAHALLALLPNSILHVLHEDGHFSIGRHIPQQVEPIINR